MRKRATRKLRSSFPVPSLFRHTVRIGELAIEHRLPTMFIQKDYVRAGGLMSYGVDFVLMAGRTGDYVAKILKGAKAGDLPSRRRRNSRSSSTSRPLERSESSCPLGILLRADEVIE